MRYICCHKKSLTKKINTETYLVLLLCLKTGPQLDNFTETMAYVRSLMAPVVVNEAPLRPLTDKRLPLRPRGNVGSHWLISLTD